MKKISILLLIISSLLFNLEAREYVSKSEIKKLQKKYGNRAGERFSNWNKLMKKHSRSSKLLQARSIDSYFNLYRYKGDYKVNSEGKRYKSDYFRSFDDFVGKFGGDCDDYAIVKYFSLLKLGVPESKLELWIGGYRSKKINHAVLAYYIDGRRDPLILDSNTRYPVRLSKRRNFIPWAYANRDKSGVFEKTLKRYGEYKNLHKYESFAEYNMLKIDRWFRKNSF